MADMTEQLKDAHFAQQYFKDCEDGMAVTKKLMQDQASCNAPEVIAALVQALNEADPIDEQSDESIQFRQATAGLSSSSQGSASAVDSGETTKESSDGTSREERGSSTSSSSPLFSKKSS